MEEEIWKDVIGYEGLYKISNFGRVKSLARWTNSLFGKPRYLAEKIMKPRTNSCGYYTVSLCKNGIKTGFLIHRLIGEHFIPNPTIYPQINHKNGIKTDNEIENLEWCDAEYNMKHAYRTGLIDNKGENSLNSKLTDEQVLNIRKEHNSGLTQRQLAKRYNVSQHCIYSIINGKTWTHLKIDVIRRYDGIFSQKLMEEDVLQIRALYIKNPNYLSIARKFNISPTHARRIIRREKWKHI